MDIVVLSETKKKGRGSEHFGNFLHFWSGVDKSTRAKAGVSILVKREQRRNIKDWEYISERIIKLEMVVYGKEVCIIGIYAPTNDVREAEKDEFWDQLREDMEAVPQRKEIFLMGDMNARVGRETASNIIGRHGEEVRNDNGSRLIELCDQFNMKVANTFFQHKAIHTATWNQPTRCLSSLIDYIVVKQSSSFRLADVRAYRGADCGSDHYLVKARCVWPWTSRNTVGGRITTNKSDGGNMQDRGIINVDLLKDPSIRGMYVNRLEAELDETFSSGAEEMYQYMTGKVQKIALEVLGNKINNGRNKWLNGDILEEIEKKKEAYGKWLSSKKESDRKEYVGIRKELNKKIRTVKNEEWERTCAGITSQLGFNRSKEAWKVLRDLRSNTRTKIKLEQIKIGEWQSYFHDLLNERRDHFVIEDQDLPASEGDSVEWRVSEEEVMEVLKKGKNGKSPGSGGVNMELWKCGGRKLVTLITRLVNAILRGGPIPEEMKLGYIVPIFKKGDRKQCTSYRGITVTSALMKVLGRLIKERLEREFTTPEVQSGFTAGRSCVDHIFTLRQLLEKQRDRGISTELVFIDLKKAYDSVPRTLLWRALRTAGISESLIGVIKRIYSENKCFVRVGTRASAVFSTSKGLLQGCCMSPILFKIYLSVCLEEWTRKCQGMGIKLQEDLYLFNLLFADDQVLIAQDEEDINYLARKLNEEYLKWGLDINLEKTEYMTAHPENECEIGGVRLKKVSVFKYLGSHVRIDGTSDEDIEKRVTSARKAIGMLNPVLWSSNILMRTKRLMYDALVQSILLYAAETWTVSKRLQGRITATEMDFWRRSAKKSRWERRRNSEIRRAVEREESVMEVIGKRKLAWFGHIKRMREGRMPKAILQWYPQGRRKRGRPRKNWKEGIDEIMTGRGLCEEDALNREYWRVVTGAG